ncbi:MAG: efflux RND transporter periplasmic adaptor subunit [Hyphomicrobiaceae bacterium]
MALLILFVAPPTTVAHEGHDHGPPAAGGASPPSPRVLATSERYQFVGIVEGEVLVIYLDRSADNVPVTTATMEVSIDGTSSKAELQKDGTYEISSPRLKTPGSHEVLVTLADGELNDLLIGAVVIPAAAQAQTDQTSLLARLLSTVPQLTGPSVAAPNEPRGQVSAWRTTTIPAAALLAVGLLLGLLLPRRRLIVALVVGLSALLMAASAYAHEGHDHGPDASGTSGNAPARRPDGTIFLPKPSQRLLEVRTQRLQPTTQLRSARLTGRIVANPNFSGVVQSTIQGRYQSPPGGVPLLGQRVAAGELLGRVAPSFASIDASDMSQKLGEIDQQIAVTRAKLARIEPLMKSNAVSRGTVEETQIQLDGLVRRREELLASRVRAEDLRAPVDGVIAAVRVISGQVISQTDQVFQIVNPSEVFIEGLIFDQIDPDAIVEAQAVTSSGLTLNLSYVGRSRTLQQQYTLIQFKVTGSGSAINVGMPVTIIARTGEPVTGLFVPRAAIAQAPNGQPVVFVHKEPEVFAPTAVRSEVFDAQSVLVSGGIKAGDQIVIENAPLINQVR